MAKQAKKTKKAKTAPKAKTSKRTGAAKMKAAGRATLKASKKAAPKKTAAKKSTVKKSAAKAKTSAKKMMDQESRDAHHNALLSQSTEYMTEHGQMPKRRGTRAKAPKTIERTAKPEAIPIRQPQLHTEN